MTKILQLQISKLNRDSTQVRVALCGETAEQYAQFLLDGGELPPIDVFQEGRVYWIGDGFTRVEAHIRADRKYINATVHEGGQRDALLFAAGANSRHGKRMTRADNRRAITLLLTDPEWCQWSDRKIAEICGGLSHGLVGDVRAELSGVQAQMETGRATEAPGAINGHTRKVERNGTVYEMKVRKPREPRENPRKALMAECGELIGEARDVASEVGDPATRVVAALDVAMTEQRAVCLR